MVLDFVFFSVLFFFFLGGGSCFSFVVVFLGWRCKKQENNICLAVELSCFLL